MPAKHYIDGRWTADENAREGETLNPSTGEAVGTFSAGGPAEIDAAVHAARRAFERGGWCNAPRVRAAAMLAMADAIAARRAEIVRIAVSECGKLIREMEHEVDAAVSEMRYYAGLARAVFGRVQEVGPGAQSIFSREPIGVAGIIVPWNAPVTLLARSLGPALAAGCTVVIKPAAQTVLTNAALIEAIASIDGLPPGVVNSVHEIGADASRRLVAHPEVDVISFTGSTATGKQIMAAAAPTMKRLSLELGGKSPAILFEDCDLRTALDVVVRSALAAAGQMCTASQRVLAAPGVYKAVCEGLAARLEALRVGRADDPSAQMGPVIDRANQARLLALTAEPDDDVEVLLRGRVPEGLPAGGSFVAPGLVATQNLQSRYIQSELFGPVLSVERFAGEAEAADRANATVYGLAASVWTRDGARARRLARVLKAGTVWINAHNRLFAEAETGGFKQSGLGRLHGLEGLDDFLETKHVYEEFGFTPAQRVP